VHIKLDIYIFSTFFSNHLISKVVYLERRKCEIGVFVIMICLSDMGLL